MRVGQRDEMKSLPDKESNVISTALTVRCSTTVSQRTKLGTGLCIDLKNYVKRVLPFKNCENRSTKTIALFFKDATRSREMPTSKHATILWTLSLTSRPVSTSLASATKEGIAHASVQR